MTSRCLVGFLAVVACAAALAEGAPAPPASAPQSGATVKLTLDEALTRVLRAHPDVQTARAGIVLARAQAKIQQARRWPLINLGYSLAEIKSLARTVSVGGGTIVSGGGRRTLRDAAVTLDFSLFESGRDQQIARAETQALAAELALPEAQRQLTFEVKRSYYEILAQQQFARALMQSVAASERHREAVEARIEAGVAPRSDLLPVLVEVSNARLQAVQAETSLQTSEAGLRSLLQLPAGTPLELAALTPAAATPGDLAQLLEQAQANRPDVRQQNLNIRAAELNTRVAKIDAGPRLAATVSADYGDHTSAIGEAWQARLGVTYPLFDAGATHAAVTSARASEEIERQRLNTLLQQVQQDVETAYLQVKQADAALEYAGVARRDAENSLAAAEARYAEGLAIIIEVTDAQVALLRAQVAEIQARFDQATALASLDLAVAVAQAPGPAG